MTPFLIGSWWKENSSELECELPWNGAEATMWPRSDATAGGERKRETHTLSIKWKVWIGSSCHNLLWERDKLGPATYRLEVWRGRRGTIVWFINNFATIIDQRCEDIINPPRIGFEQVKRDCYQWQELRAGHLINLSCCSCISKFSSWIELLICATNESHLRP